ncbi:polyphenol oxidase family protein [Kytococcus aerolatus]|uniref:polyphenol oxidase family protein n=1 Tax=Kytococcus aerolatus TaxID=592308 RepID=UPI001F27AE7C|nr:polyphenol oxidase family protein [Kytococcus aerolatus]
MTPTPAPRGPRTPVWWHESLPAVDDLWGVEWLFTRRAVDHFPGAGSLAGFNLGDHVGDDPVRVARHRRILAAGLGVGAEDLHWMHQVHGATVRVLDADASRHVPAGSHMLPEGDGLVLDAVGRHGGGLEPGAAVVVVADCTPVLLVDRRRGLLAVAHAGRPGMLAGVVPATVAALRARGATDLEAVVGPSVCGRCYEVPERMRAEAMAAEPTCGGRTAWGTPSIDVATTVVEQLVREDVLLRHWVQECTLEEEDLFSHRRDGSPTATGRFAGAVRLVAPSGVGA